MAGQSEVHENVPTCRSRAPSAPSGTPPVILLQRAIATST
jgi:hypothetical protein